MKKSSIKSSLKKLEKSDDPRLALVRKYLKQCNARVGEWYDHYLDESGQPADMTYYACLETRRVFIPVPVDNYSLYICLHEIGHIATGSYQYAYLQEYHAETWALDKLRKHGYYRKGFEKQARKYVLNTLYEDICLRFCKLDTIPLRIQRWLDRDRNRINRGAVIWLNKWLKYDAVEINSVDDVHAIAAMKKYWIKHLENC